MSHYFVPAIASGSPGHLDVLMLTGFLLAFFQVTLYAFRRQSRDIGVALFLCSIGLAVYAVVAGAWPWQ